MTTHRSGSALLLALLGASALVAPAGATSLTAAQKRAFQVPEKDHLKPIKGDRYLRSNETELQLYGPYINGIGGGYVGVGADQNYTIAAMAQSSYVWLMDYDPFVTRLHLIYRALILDSPTAAEFRAKWKKRRVVRALLQKYYGQDSRLPFLQFVYKRYRRFLEPYHRWAIRRKRKGQGTTWLSNPTLYQRVRRMWQEGRIQPLSGDLHGTRVFKGLCAAARRLHVPIRIVYLSNAEMYLPYSANFKANMKAVPTDAKTLVVRTVRHKMLVMRGDRWHYNIQPFDDFLKRLATGRYRRIYDMMRDILRAPRAVRQKVMGPRGFSRFTADVPTLDELLKRYRERRRRQRRRRH